MGIDLDETARILTRQNCESSYLRAIRLFEFQSCLFYPEALLARENTAFQRDARLLAALKLLESLETRILAASEKGAISWQDLTNDLDYVEIFEKIILPSGGWRAIRNVWNSKEFDEQLKIRKAQARSAVKIVDFSYRFGMLRPNDKRKAGVTMAHSIICNSPSYKYRKKLSTLKTRWHDYGTTAALLYLLFVQKFELMPPWVRSNEFSETLLKTNADIDHLTEFFRAYRHLCEVLGPRGYRFPPIRTVEGILAQPLVVEPFPKDVEEAIQNYTSA